MKQAYQDLFKTNIIQLKSRNFILLITDADIVCQIKYPMNIFFFDCFTAISCWLSKMFQRTLFDKYCNYTFIYSLVYFMHVNNQRFSSY